MASGGIGGNGLGAGLGGGGSGSALTHFHQSLYNNSRGRWTSHIYHSKEDLKRAAQHPLRLVPIRLDLEIDGQKIRDTFTWNLNESLMTVEHFSQLLVDDYFDHQPSNYREIIRQVATSIIKQCEAWQGSVDEEEDLDTTHPSRSKKPPTPKEQQDLDWRTVIKLDLQVGNVRIADQFEWPLLPLTYPRGNAVQVPYPEQYAQKLCAELGIGGEFAGDIAHAIREQLCYARLNFEEAEKMVDIFMPPLRATEEMEEWTPAIEELSDGEIERREKEQERTARRLRRSSRVNTNTITINRAGYLGAASAEPNNHDSDEDDSDAYSDDSEQGGGRLQPNRSVPAGGPARRRNYQPPSFAMNSFRVGKVQMVGMHPNRVGSMMVGRSATSMIPNGNSYMNHIASSREMMHQQSQLYRQSVPFGSPTSQQNPQKIPYRNYRPTNEEEKEILRKLQDATQGASLAAAQSPPKKHRGFGASAQKFNGDGSLQVGEFREKWRCSWCLLSGKFTPTLRRGPMGSKTLCNACGIWYGKHGNLPADRYREHEND